MQDENEGKVLLSTELICCGNHPMLVFMPETLSCQICNKSYMSLVIGVQKPYYGFELKKGFEYVKKS